MMLQIDTEIHQACSTRGVVYSRYADDIFLSTSQPNVLDGLERAVDDIVQHAKMPSGLRLEPAKTRHLSRKRLRRITGVVITPNAELSVGRHRKREIRSLIHDYDALDDEGRRRLAGLLGFALDVEPDLANRLVRKYGASAVARAMKPPV